MASKAEHQCPKDANTGEDACEGASSVGSGAHILHTGRWG